MTDPNTVLISYTGDRMTNVLHIDARARRFWYILADAGTYHGSFFTPKGLEWWC